MNLSSSSPYISHLHDVIFEGGVVSERLLAERARRDDVRRRRRPRRRDCGVVTVRLRLDVVGICKKREKMSEWKGERGKRITHLDYDYGLRLLLLFVAFDSVSSRGDPSPLYALWSIPLPTRLRENLATKTQPLGGNLLFLGEFLPLPCKLPCRKSRLFSFFPLFLL